MSAQPWPKYPLLYEINTRVWLAELGQRAGRPMTLDRVPDEHFDRWAEQGFHGVWLMGVWTTGPAPTLLARTHPGLQADYHQALSDYKEADCIGSPYAITEYVVAPGLGGPAGLARFREKLARRGLKLMLDFVCNHTATDHPLLRTQPEAFIQGTQADLSIQPPLFFSLPGGQVIAHGRDPYFPAWTDTAQVNYAHPIGRSVMLNELQNIATQCDGVRCDMAMLILPEVLERTWGGRLGSNPVRESFWKEAIASIRRLHPNFLFMAESYWNLEWELQQQGFDFTYDKTLYDRLHRSEFDGVRKHLRADPIFADHCARFIENHDEPRAASAFGPGRARSAAVATFLVPGLKLLHEGQLEGWKTKLPVQLGRRPQESEDVETAIFYDRLLALLRDPLFQSGHFQQLDVNSAGWNDDTHQSLLALVWEPAGERTTRQRLGYLIVVNLGPHRAYGRIPFKQQGLQDGTQYLFHDHADGKNYERQGGELRWPGLYVALEGHQSHWFEVSAK